MGAFNLYAQYYDLLYKEKDYKTEADYVAHLIKKSCPDAKVILNLGCGTGKHDIELSRLGYKMTGIDLSDQMVKIACDNGLESHQNIRFMQGDVRNINLNEEFDAIISLFHVMSYQNTNEDLLKTFCTARGHLKDGGVFIFDCWYGPGVMNDPPVVRIKRLESDRLKIIRLAEPVVHPNEDIVDVNYTILLDGQDEGYTTIKECHRMRYLFAPEIKNMLEQSGMKLECVYDWLKFEKPDIRSWNACFVAVK